MAPCRDGAEQGFRGSSRARECSIRCPRRALSTVIRAADADNHGVTQLVVFLGDKEKGKHAVQSMRKGKLGPSPGFPAGAFSDSEEDNLHQAGVRLDCTEA